MKDIFPFLWFFVSQNKNYEVSEEGGREGGRSTIINE
jgi:hypothetical protein